MSQTDGSWVCGRCCEWQTVCGLCVDEPEHLVKGPEHDSYINQRKDAEYELHKQSMSIRRAADIRQGW